MNKKEIDIAHKEVLSDLERFLGYKVEKAELMEMDLRKDGHWGQYFCRGIGIDKILFNFDHENGYYKHSEFDFARNVLKCSSIKDLFKNVLTHEYFHDIFDNKYKDDMKHIVVENMLNSNSIPDNLIIEQIAKQVLGINEAFAFWGEDKIEFHKSLYEDTVQTMKHVNPKTTKFFYKLFHKISDENTDRFVTDNLTKIVERNIKKVEDTKLKTVAEVLDDRLRLPLGSLKDYKLPPIIRFNTDMVARVYDPINKYRY